MLNNHHIELNYEHLIFQILSEAFFSCKFNCTFPNRRYLWLIIPNSSLHWKSQSKGDLHDAGSPSCNLRICKNWSNVCISNKGIPSIFYGKSNNFRSQLFFFAFAMDFRYIPKLWANIPSIINKMDFQYWERALKINLNNYNYSDSLSSIIIIAHSIQFLSHFFLL